MKIEWTPEKRIHVCDILSEWLIEHGASSGETIMQDDDCQLDAPELLSNIVDNVIKPIIEDADYL
jgi:hypothetical protein